MSVAEHTTDRPEGHAPASESGRTTSHATNHAVKQATGQTASQAADRLLTPAEVAALFRVDPKTVTRWAQAGKLSAIRTLGGHRRYRESEVRGLLETG